MGGRGEGLALGKATNRQAALGPEVVTFYSRRDNLLPRHDIVRRLLPYL